MTETIVLILRYIPPPLTRSLRQEPGMSVIVATFDPADCDPSSCVLCLAKIRRQEDAPLWKRTFRVSK